MLAYGGLGECGFAEQPQSLIASLRAVGSFCFSAAKASVIGRTLVAAKVSALTNNRSNGLPHIPLNARTSTDSNGRAGVSIKARLASLNAVRTASKATAKISVKIAAMTSSKVSAKAAEYARMQLAAMANAVNSGSAGYVAKIAMATRGMSLWSGRGNATISLKLSAISHALTMTSAGLAGHIGLAAIAKTVNSGFIDYALKAVSSGITLARFNGNASNVAILKTLASHSLGHLVSTPSISGRIGLVARNKQITSMRSNFAMIASLSSSAEAMISGALSAVGSLSISAASFIATISSAVIADVHRAITVAKLGNGMGGMIPVTGEGGRNNNSGSIIP